MNFTHSYYNVKSEPYYQDNCIIPTCVQVEILMSDLIWENISLYRDLFNKFNASKVRIFMSLHMELEHNLHIQIGELIEFPILKTNLDPAYNDVLSDYKNILEEFVKANRDSFDSIESKHNPIRIFINYKIDYETSLK